MFLLYKTRDASNLSGLMAWSPISMSMSGKEDGGVQLFFRASFRNKYSSFSWTEDETAAVNKEVSPFAKLHDFLAKRNVPRQSYSWMKDRIQPEESRRQTERIRELNSLAERMGCTLAQLAIAWSLKNESVQCLLLGASSVDQLYESIQALQVGTFSRGKTRRSFNRLLVRSSFRSSTATRWPKWSEFWRTSLRGRRWCPRWRSDDNQCAPLAPSGTKARRRAVL